MIKDTLNRDMIRKSDLFFILILVLNFSNLIYYKLNLKENNEFSVDDYESIYNSFLTKFNESQTYFYKNICDENEITIKDLSYCSKCKYVLNCSSGCRASASYLTDDLLDADPKACYLHPLVYKYVIGRLPDNVVKTYEQYLNKNGLDPKYTKKDLDDILVKKGFKNELRNTL